MLQSICKLMIDLQPQIWEVSHYSSRILLCFQGSKQMFLHTYIHRSHLFQNICCRSDLLYRSRQNFHTDKILLQPIQLEHNKEEVGSRSSDHMPHKLEQESKHHTLVWPHYIHYLHHTCMCQYHQSCYKSLKIPRRRYFLWHQYYTVISESKIFDIKSCWLDFKE